MAMRQKSTHLHTHLLQLQQRLRQAQNLYGLSGDLLLREVYSGHIGLQMWQAYGKHDGLHSVL